MDAVPLLGTFKMCVEPTLRLARLFADQREDARRDTRGIGTAVFTGHRHACRFAVRRQTNTVGNRVNRFGIGEEVRKEALFALFCCS